MSDVQILQQQNSQRDQARRATREDLFGKKARRQTFTTKLSEDGDELTLELVALDGPAFDDLTALHPPTDEQRKKNPTANVNGDTFPAALLAGVCQDPKLDVEDWQEIFTSKEWSTGELTSLYWAANSLCNTPLELTPFGKD